MSHAADAATDAPWPERRFSQAIAEGDGISLIPTLVGDVRALAGAAEQAGAEAILVTSTADVRVAREATGLPVLLTLSEPSRAELEAARADGADAVAISASALAAHGAAAYRDAVGLGLDCAIRVADEDELEVVLEALEPEILVAALGEDESGGLALLTDVPVGKLVVVEAPLKQRDDVVALERAGVDAAVLDAPQSATELVALLQELIGAERPLE